jgi:hypothetical protein
MTDTAAVAPVTAPVADTGAASDVQLDANGLDANGLDANEPGDGESFEDFKARTEGKKTRGKNKAKEPVKAAESEPESEAETSNESDSAAESDTEPEGSTEKAEAEFQPVKLKYGDEEIEITSMDQLTKIAQKGLGAERKFQEAASIRKTAEKLVATLKDNPIEILRHPALRDKMIEAAQELLFEHIQHEQMSAEDRARLQEREELERYRRAEQERKVQEETKQREELRDKYRQDYERQFIEALNDGGIPKSDWAVTRMAQYMRQAIKTGMSNIAPKDVVHLVKRDWQQAQSELYGQLDGDKLIQMLGPDIAEKIRKADVAKLTSKGRPQQKAPQVVEASEPRTRRRFSSPDQMLESL